MGCLQGCHPWLSVLLGWHATYFGVLSGSRPAMPEECRYETTREWEVRTS